MIINFLPRPHDPGHVAAEIADAILGACGGLAVRDFVPLLSRHGNLDVSICIPNDYRFDTESAKIMLSSNMSEKECGGFDCAIPVTEGIIRSRMAVKAGLETYLIDSAANRYVEKWGRPFADTSETEITQLIDKDLGRYCWPKHCHQWNEALCSELARREVDIRASESAHERVNALVLKDAAREFLITERSMSASWWRRLSKADCDHLPHYEYRDLAPDDRVLFAYRDYSCEVARFEGATSFWLPPQFSSRGSEDIADFGRALNAEPLP